VARFVPLYYEHCGDDPVGGRDIEEQVLVRLRRGEKRR